MGDHNSFTITQENVTGVRAKYIGKDIRLLGPCPIPRFTNMTRMSDPTVNIDNLGTGDWVASDIQKDGTFFLYNSSQNEPKLMIEPQIGA